MQGRGTKYCSYNTYEISVTWAFERCLFLFYRGQILFHFLYTGCPRRNGKNFGRVFLLLNYTDITQNTCIQSWTVTEIMAIEKCGLLGCPRTVCHPWCHTCPVRMPGNETPLANIVMQWPWRDNWISCGPRKVLGNPKDNYGVSASVFVVQFNGFMSLTS